MKRLVYSLALLLLVLQPFSADARPRKHIIGFYNLENLFDTTHDEGKDDSMSSRTSSPSRRSPPQAIR